MITYLTGAGASANSIPTVSTFFSCDTSINFIEGLKIASKKHLGNRRSQIAIELIKEFESASRSSSPDTHASSIRHFEERYVNFKSIIASIVLLSEFKSGLDRRYDNLFHALIDEPKKLDLSSEKSAFITWNYDSQLETALSVRTNCSIHILKNKLYSESYSTDKISIIKLNSKALQADSIGSENSKIQYNLGGFNGDTIEQRFADYLVELSHAGNNKLHEMINYSWDRRGANDALTDACRIMNETTELVIIGYSFPSFNRIEDYELLNSLHSDAIIYLQCNGNASESGNKITQSRLQGLFKFRLKNMIQPMYDSTQFYVPFNNDPKLKIKI